MQAGKDKPRHFELNRAGEVESPPSLGRGSWLTCLPAARLKVAMYTRQDLMRTLGLSYRQLRERLDALAAADGLLDGQVRKGTKGRWEYSPAVLEMLKELDQLAKTFGMGLRQAAQEVASMVKEKPQGNSNGNRGKLDGNGGNHTAGELEALRIKVEALERENAFLREELGRVWKLVDDVRALPPPRRRWWWPFRKG